MTFLWPALLLAILLVPLGLLLTRRIDRRRHGRVAALTGSTPPAASSVTRRRRARLLDRVPAVLAVAALVVLAIGLARPQATVAQPRLEGTLMLTFDVSGSMAATDASPTRMDEAKAVAKTIVERKPDGVIIGVVAFSDSGLAVVPPTQDTTAVLAAIDRMTPTRGTSLGGGILATLDAIAKSQADTPTDYYSNRSPDPTPSPAPAAPGSDASTLIVVLSDGENNQRPDPATAAQAAADQGIRIVSIGVGTAAGTTLDLGGFKVQTALDAATLQQIADTTAGTYQPAADGDPAAAVYDELARKLVVHSEPTEVTALLAAVALVLLVAAAALSLARSGRLP